MGRNTGLALALCTGMAMAETVTVAALGDSLTQGFGLTPEEGFVPQLEAWLIAEGADVALINAGVSGDTTAGGLSRVAWTLTPEVDAMIVALGGNDFLRGIDPAVARANLDGILAAAEEAGVEVLLVGLQASNQYGPDYRRDFNGMYTDLSEEYGTPLYPDIFAGLRTEGGTAEAVRAFMQPDGIHPNPEGVALIVADIGPAVLDLVESVE